MQEDTDERAVGNLPGYRTWILAVFALGLAVVSALGALDEFGQNFVADTMAESIGLLLVSMGFDAGISALQELPIVGAGLDPINDAVERLSTVIVWAIGSLLLQRTALELVSSAAFQWGFVALCVLAVPLLVLFDRRSSGTGSTAGIDRYRGWLVRILVVAAMVRFFVPVFLAGSATVSNVVLQPEIDEHSANLAALSAEIFGAEEPVPDEQANAEPGADRQDAAAPADEEVSAVASGDGEGVDPVPGNGDAAQAVPADQDGAEPEPTDQEGFLGGLIGGLSAAQDAAIDILSGVSLPEMPDAILPEIPDLATVQAMAEEGVQLLTRLLVAIAIKNIALPLVFLWIALKAAVPLARWLIGLGTFDGRESRELTSG